jgi:hypothetical protein
MVEWSTLISRSAIRREISRELVLEVPACGDDYGDDDDLGEEMAAFEELVQAWSLAHLAGIPAAWPLSILPSLWLVPTVRRSCQLPADRSFSHRMTKRLKVCSFQLVPHTSVLDTL